MPVPKRTRAAYTARLRKLCLSYPEVVEVEQFGSPWWKAGKKSFCIASGMDGEWGAAFNVSKEEQLLLTEDPRFTPTRYVGQHGWTSLRFEVGRVDWDEVEELVDLAYRHVALKRMLKALDGN